MIRRAVPDDLPALAVLEAELFGADAWDEAALRAELEGPGRTFLVVGDLSAYAVTMTLGDVVDLQRIGVRPAARRTGVATELLAALLQETGEADRVLLEVSAGNADALAFYEARGFSRIDVRPRYYRDGSDAVVMWLPLHPVGEDGGHG